MSRRNSIFRRSVARIMDHGFHDEEEAREAVRRVIRCIANTNLVLKSEEKYFYVLHRSA